MKTVTAEKSPLATKGSELDALSAAISKLYPLMDLNWYLGAMCQIVVEGLKYKMAWIGFADFQSGKVLPLAQAGFEKGYLRTVDIRCDDTPLGRGPTGTAIRTGTPTVQNRMDTDPNYFPWRDEARNRGYRSSAAFPLTINGTTIGALTAYSGDTDAFEPEEIQSLRLYAERASVRIMKILLNEKLQTQLPEVKLPSYKLEASESYLVPAEDSARSFRIFEEHLKEGWNGLCITRQHPKQVQRRYDLGDAQVFWLTEEKGATNIESLLEISVLVGGFVGSIGSKIVLLDGLEYLVSRNSFEAIYKFIQNQRNRIATSEAMLLVAVHPQAFPAEKIALFKRELVAIPSAPEDGSRV